MLRMTETSLHFEALRCFVSTIDQTGKTVKQNKATINHVNTHSSSLPSIFSSASVQSAEVVTSCYSGHTSVLRETCLDESTVGSPAAGGRGFPEKPQSQRQTGKPCDPALHRSGADRNP